MLDCNGDKIRRGKYVVYERAIYRVRFATKRTLTLSDGSTTLKLTKRGRLNAPTTNVELIGIRRFEKKQITRRSIVI